mmetsp:Transcript_41007/g.95325  ORF Transcript_41007/g.95325 Transcript_41007/m.95325 type:complete len:303 (+) Transcript_41007:344-1252(+)
MQRSCITRRNSRKAACFRMPASSAGRLTSPSFSIWMKGSLSNAMSLTSQFSARKFLTHCSSPSRSSSSRIRKTRAYSYSSEACRSWSTAEEFSTDRLLPRPLLTETVTLSMPALPRGRRPARRLVAERSLETLARRGEAASSTGISVAGEPGCLAEGAEGPEPEDRLFSNGGGAPGGSDASSGAAGLSGVASFAPSLGCSASWPPEAGCCPCLLGLLSFLPLLAAELSRFLLPSLSAAPLSSIWAEEAFSTSVAGGSGLSLSSGPGRLIKESRFSILAQNSCAFSSFASGACGARIFGSGEH